MNKVQRNLNNTTVKKGFEPINAMYRNKMFSLLFLNAQSW